MLVAIAFASYAPTPLSAQGREPREVSVAFVGVPVADALAQLSSLSGMSLVWGSEITARSTGNATAASRVSCRFTNAPAEQVLACITREAGLDWYRLSSGTYVVTERAERAPAYASIGGQVIDATTGDPINTASVRLAELPQSRAVGESGAFAFDRLAPGTYAMTVQAIGYRPWRGEITVEPSGARRERIALDRASVLAAPVVINGLQLGAASAALAANTYADSLRLPLVQPMGFFVPGTPMVMGVSRRDGTGDLHIQGGEVGEHQWRLDGIPLYDAAALSGLFGIVAPAAIEQMTVRRAGFRAGGGSHSAGAIDLTHAYQADGARTPSATLEADPLAMQARLVAPFALGSARVSSMLAWREGLWDWTAPSALSRAFREWNAPDAVLMQRLSQLTGLPSTADADVASFAARNTESRVGLRDVHAAFRVDLPDFQRYEFSAFVSRHTLGAEGRAHDPLVGGSATHDGYRWATDAAQLSHKMFLGTRVAQTVQFRAVRHTLAHDAWVAMDSAAGGGIAATMMGDEGNRIDDVALAADWSLSGSNRIDAQWGAELVRVSAQMRASNALLRPIDSETAVGRATAWGDLTSRLGASLWLESGLRVTRLEADRVFAEPRVALRREGESTRLGPYTWRLAFGGYHQFVNQFDVATTMPVAVVPSLRFWWPTDGARGVPLSWHASAEGVLRPAAGWELRAEVYGKWQPVLLAFDYGVLFDGTSTLTGDAFAQRARGRVAGVGLRAQRSTTMFSRPTRLALSYDGGMAQRTFPSRFGGAMQPTPWLEPHRALASMEFEPSTNTVLAVRTRGVWGRSWALRQNFYDLLGLSAAGAGLSLDDPGSSSRPAIVETDIGARWTRAVVGARVEIGLAAQNVFDRRNVLDFGLRRASVDVSRYEMVPRHLPGRQFTVTLRVAPSRD